MKSKKKYEYKLDHFNFIDNASVIYCMLHGHFHSEFEKYAFDENTKIIRKIISDKGDKIDKNIIQSFDELLKEITKSFEKKSSFLLKRKCFNII